LLNIQATTWFGNFQLVRAIRTRPRQFETVWWWESKKILREGKMKELLRDDNNPGAV